mmetsp:Transcript_59374/g.133788  ORF Transcript_59374/g.133788 Transcript_59374/m.133788 type:complete len:319 (-) Transcript_59374:6-962(-)
MLPLAAFVRRCAVVAAFAFLAAWARPNGVAASVADAYVAAQDGECINSQQEGSTKGNSFIAKGTTIVRAVEPVRLAEFDDLEDSVLLSDDGYNLDASDPVGEFLVDRPEPEAMRHQAGDFYGVQCCTAFLLIAVLVGYHIWRRVEAGRDDLVCTARREAGGEQAELPQKSHQTMPAAEEVDDFGCTVLHVASDRGLASEVETLLQEGYDPNAREAWEETPLHFAARNGNINCCKLLIEYGGEVNPESESGHTPLLTAAHAGNESVCKFLMASGGHVGGLADSDLPPLLSALLLEHLFTDVKGGREASAHAVHSTLAEQ